MATLSISKLYKRFGSVEVLKGINLEARTGEFIALVGPSGCGKSTLLAMIAGLETVSEGEIRIDGTLVNSVAPKDRDIAMVFQSYALYPTMTARQNITFGMESRRVPKADQDAAVKRVASLLQIEPLLDRKPGQLSGGQRQRVAMGRALVRDPKLFLFDEPLSNLDAKLRVDMRTEIKKLHLRVGKTTIYVTHDQIEAMTLASRIAVMHQGSIQQFDEPQVVYDHPANIFVAGFMGSPSMNFIPGELTKVDGRPAVAIALAGGETVTLPLAQPPQSWPANGKVVLGVRPEHLFRYDPNLKSQKAGLAMLTAPVEVVEPTGAETHAVLKIGEREVVGRFDPDGAPRLGELLPLGIDMAHACLFDPETQALIPQAAVFSTFAAYPSLQARAVFVSGGATGIGADIVRAFAKNHARVAFVDLQRHEGEALAAGLKETGETALFLRCDVTDVPALKASIAEAGAKLGPIAVLVNNAANDERHAVADVTADYWDHAQNVNLRHHFFAAQAVHPQMRELGFGSIINLSSIAWRGASEMPAYSAAKAGIIGLTHALARAFGSDNIRVNAIEPGAVMTDRQRRLWYKTPESVDAIVQRQSIKETLLGEDIARMALFLAADDSRMVTKQSITVDAGLR